MRYSPKPPVLSPVQPTLRALVRRSQMSLTFGTRGWMNWLLITLAVCGSPYSCASWFSSTMTLISSFHWLSMISRAGRTAHTSSVPGLCKCYILYVKYKMNRFWMLIGQCSVPAPLWNLIAPYRRMDFTGTCEGSPWVPACEEVCVKCAIWDRASITWPWVLCYTSVIFWTKLCV